MLVAFVIMGLVAVPFAGCATARGPRQIDATFGNATEPASNWSRVMQLQPGADIFLSVRSQMPGTRCFVAADPSSLVVLDLTVSALSTASARVLRDMAVKHPANLEAVQKVGVFSQGNVRVGRDGVFVDERKVAELNQVLETIGRSDVSEISGPVVARGSVAGTVAGGWLGFAVGVVPGLGGASDGVAWLSVVGATALGGYLGFHWSSHETEGIVYRAP